MRIDELETNLTHSEAGDRQAVEEAERVGGGERSLLYIKTPDILINKWINVGV